MYSNSTITLSTRNSECKICELPAHGNHLGVLSCRACAAFFRRAITGPKRVYQCKKENRCQIFQNGRYNCKKCRLEKCKKLGMDPNKFQFNRDPILSIEKIQERSVKIFGIPETIEHFLGIPHFLAFYGPQTRAKRSYIDFQHLIKKASQLLDHGAEKPLIARNNLVKLTMGLNMIRNRVTEKGDVKVVRKIGKEEAFLLWEKDFLAVAKWLTYFDDFQLLSNEQQMAILKSIWQTWCRFERTHLTVQSRIKKICEPTHCMISYNLAGDPKITENDISWFCRYPKEQVLYFFNGPEECVVEDAIEPLEKLQPTDTEFVFLLCQLCLHHAGKKLHGDVLHVIEKVRDKLSDDLHEYYLNSLNMPRYLGRLSQLLKINNIIHEKSLQRRTRQELAWVLGIFNADVSHPEMFLE